MSRDPPPRAVVCPPRLPPGMLGTAAASRPVPTPCAIPAPHMPTPHALRTLSPTGEGTFPTSPHAKPAPPASQAPGAVPEPCRLLPAAPVPPPRPRPERRQLPAQAGQAGAVRAPGAPSPRRAGAATGARTPGTARGRRSRCPRQLCTAGAGCGATATHATASHATASRVTASRVTAAPRHRGPTRKSSARGAGLWPGCATASCPRGSTVPTARARPSPALPLPAAPRRRRSPRSSQPVRTRQGRAGGGTRLPAHRGLAPQQGPGTTVVGDPPAGTSPPRGSPWRLPPGQTPPGTAGTAATRDTPAAVPDRLPKGRGPPEPPMCRSAPDRRLFCPREMPLVRPRRSVATGPLNVPDTPDPPAAPRSRGDAGWHTLPRRPEPQPSRESQRHGTARGDAALPPQRRGRRKAAPADPAAAAPRGAAAPPPGAARGDASPPRRDGTGRDGRGASPGVVGGRLPCGAMRRAKGTTTHQPQVPDDVALPRLPGRSRERKAAKAGGGRSGQSRRREPSAEKQRGHQSKETSGR